MKKISSIVVSIHFIFLLWFGFFETPPNQFEQKKLVVKHFLQKPQQKQIIQKTTSKQPILPSKPKATPSALKNPEKKSSASLSSVPVKKNSSPPPTQPSSKTKSSPITKKLMKELEESIAKIEGNRDKVDTSKQLKAPQAIETLKIDIPEENEMSDYNENLILCLRQSLHLPDFGEVKIKITLRKDGSVDQLAVLKAESENNRRYLETHLPLIQFPAPKKEKYTFVLTFCNEV